MDIKAIEEKLLVTLWEQPDWLQLVPNLDATLFSFYRPVFQIIKDGKPDLSLLDNPEVFAAVLDKTVPISNIETFKDYVNLLAQNLLKWRLRRLCDKIIANIENEKPEALIHRLNESLQSLLLSTEEIYPLKNLIDNLILRLERKSADDVVGLFGLPTLDKWTGKLRKGTLVVIAAPTSVGKTSMAIHMALSSAASGYPALFLSLEMSEHQIASRIASHLTNISTSDFYRMETDNIAIQKLRNIPTLNFFYSDKAWDTHQLESAVLMGLHRFNTRLVLIDYLQKVFGVKNFEQREAQVSEVAKTLKRIARQYDLSVVALSQVNNEKEFRARESRVIEHESDILIRLKPDDAVKDRVLAILWKNRMGETGTLALLFHRPYAKFEEVGELEPEETGFGNLDDFKDTEIDSDVSTEKYPF